MKKCLENLNVSKFNSRRDNRVLKKFEELIVFKISPSVVIIAISFSGMTVVSWCLKTNRLRLLTDHFRENTKALTIFVRCKKAPEDKILLYFQSRISAKLQIIHQNC